MKKWTVFFLTVILGLSLVACSGGGFGNSIDQCPSLTVPLEDANAQGMMEITTDGWNSLSAIVPDFLAFSNGSATQNEDATIGNQLEDRTIFYYAFASEAGDVLIPEYIELLKNSEMYTLRGSFSNPVEKLSYYWFSYDGNEEVVPFSLSMCNASTNMQTIETGEIHLFLADIDRTELGAGRQLALHHSPELSLSDTGDRTTYHPSSTSAVSTPTPTATPAPTATPCSTPEPTTPPPVFEEPFDESVEDSGLSAHTLADMELPSPDEFFHGELGLEKNGINGSTHSIVLTAGMDEVDALEEYVELLQTLEYLSLRTYDVRSFDSENDGYNHYYIFNYVGTGSIRDAQAYKSYYNANVSAPVIVQIDKGYGSSCLAIDASADFTFVDVGDRCSVSGLENHSVVPGSGAGGSSTVGSFSGSFSSSGTSWQPCTKCFGKGDIECSNCDGSGGKWVYNNSTPKYGGLPGSGPAQTFERCSKCGGDGRVTCPTCGGKKRVYY